jgi:hypothetical protein
MRRRANLRQAHADAASAHAASARAAPGTSDRIDFGNSGTSAAGARRSFMLPTAEHAANPKPIAGIDTNLVRRPLRFCFEPPRWPGCGRMTGNCNRPDTGYGAALYASGFDDTGAQIWLPPGRSTW